MTIQREGDDFMETEDKKHNIVEPKKLRPFALILSVFAFVIMWGSGMQFSVAIITAVLAFGGCEVYGRVYTNLYKKLHKIE